MGASAPPLSPSEMQSQSQSTTSTTTAPRTTVSFNEAAMASDNTTAHLLSKDMIELETLIGSGAYGQVRRRIVALAFLADTRSIQVWRARYRGEPVAVKQPKLSAVSDSLRRMLLKELRVRDEEKKWHRHAQRSSRSHAQVMSEKRHPNILLMMGAVIDNDCFWIVSELLDCTLRQLLVRQRFTLVQVRHLPPALDSHTLSMLSPL
jgi:serine/threonine protein kinase